MVVQKMEWLPANPEHVKARMVMGLNPHTPLKAWAALVPRLDSRLQLLTGRQDLMASGMHDRGSETQGMGVHAVSLTLPLTQLGWFEGGILSFWRDVGGPKAAPMQFSHSSDAKPPSLPSPRRTISSRSGIGTDSPPSAQCFIMKP